MAETVERNSKDSIQKALMNFYTSHFLLQFAESNHSTNYKTYKLLSTQSLVVNVTLLKRISNLCGRLQSSKRNFRIQESTVHLHNEILLQYVFTLWVITPSSMKFQKAHKVEKVMFSKAYPVFQIQKIIQSPKFFMLNCDIFW